MSHSAPPPEGVTTPPAQRRHETCATCAEVTGTKRYCAPARCYCGHEACHAFASYIDLDGIPLADAPTIKRRGRSAWDDREGSTWIDSL